MGELAAKIPSLQSKIYVEFCSACELAVGQGDRILEHIRSETHVKAENQLFILRAYRRTCLPLEEKVRYTPY